jgi:hypothetical protein
MSMRSVTILLLSLAAVLLFGEESRGQAAHQNNPKTLLWNYVNLTELQKNAKVWHDVKGIDGFIFCCVSDNDMPTAPPRWTSGPESVSSIYRKLPETVRALRAAGIEDNFVHAGTADPEWNWFDPARYEKIVPTFRQLAKIAKESGCVGVAIDTEPYSCDKLLWNPDGYPAEKLPELKKRIRTMGADIIEAILSEFPEAQILVVIEGSYIAVQNSPAYKLFDLWIDFFGGMISRQPANGITVVSECGYAMKDPLEIARLCGNVEGTLKQAFLGQDKDLEYVRFKCSVAMGVGVLDQPEKTSLLTPAEFSTQWKTMRSLSSKYVFIFGAESGFWQLTQDTVGALPSFKKPLAANADEYFKTIRESRVTDPPRP